MRFDLTQTIQGNSLDRSCVNEPRSAHAFHQPTSVKLPPTAKRLIRQSLNSFHPTVNSHQLKIAAQLAGHRAGRQQIGSGEPSAGKTTQGTEVTTNNARCRCRHRPSGNCLQRRCVHLVGFTRWRPGVSANCRTAIGQARRVLAAGVPNRDSACGFKSFLGQLGAGTSGCN